MEDLLQNAELIRKTLWQIIHHVYHTHQLSMIKEKGLKYIPRVAEDEICKRREIMQAACK
jgi:hypothetical protein